MQINIVLSTSVEHIELLFFKTVYRLKIDYSPEKISLTAPNVGGSLEGEGRVW